MRSIFTTIICVSCLVFQGTPLAQAVSTTETSQNIDATKLLCPDADFWGKKMFTGVCWSCLFPVRLLGMTIFDDGNDLPDGATEKSFCTCDGNEGLPLFGVTAGAWLPARLIEVVRKPYCSPILGGMSFNSGVRSAAIVSMLQQYQKMYSPQQIARNQTHQLHKLTVGNHIHL